jgi:glycosyltransferase involved in cell wall biosynthesis
MRVLHISSGNLFGGVETLLLTLGRHAGLCPELEQEVGLCFEGRLSEELRAAGAPVHPLGAVRLRDPLSVLRARRRLRRVLERERFDVAVCHSLWALVVFGPVVRPAGCSLAYWLHDRVGENHWLERLARWTVPDVVVCNSRFTAATLPRLYPRTPAEVVYCPVEAPRAATAAASAALRAELGAAPDDVVIVQVSRMEEWKGQLEHVEALGELAGLPGWVCWQVGGAQRPEELAYQERLLRRAAERGVAGRVSFLGQRSDVPRLLAAADVYCQPNSGPEPFGISFVEALHAGLPCVTSAIGGAREIVTEECGILVPPRDRRALSEALRSLIVDAELRAAMGAAGPARAAALCDPAVQLPRLREVLGRATAKAEV